MATSERVGWGEVARPTRTRIRIRTRTRTRSRSRSRTCTAALALLLSLLAGVATACGPDPLEAPQPGEDPIEEEVWLANYVDIEGDPDEAEEAVDELGGQVITERDTAEGTALLAWFPSRSLDELEGYRSGLDERGIDVSRITRDEIQQVRDALD